MMRAITRRWCVIGVVMGVAVGAAAIEYPETKRIDHVDIYHGTTVQDPYRWLERDVRESDEVAKWVEAQNEVTFELLESIEERDAIRERLTELWNYEKYGAPARRGGRYVFTRNDGLQNQSVVYIADSLDAEPEVLFDPNTWSEDGTVALAGMAFSDDGRYVAYAVQDAGSDWRTWRIREIATGTDLPDELKWIKFSGASWTTDSRGFFYSRYPKPEKGAAFQSVNLNNAIYYHRVGTSQDQDVLVYHRPDHPEWGYNTQVSEDGRWLVITVWKGTDNEYRVLYKDLTEPYGMPMMLIDEFADEYVFLGNDGHVFYFQTNNEAPRRRIVAIDVRTPDPSEWREVVPEADGTDVLRGADLIGNMFVCHYMHDAVSRVRLYDMNGEKVRDLDLPGIGTVWGLGGKRTATETFYTFTSFTTPSSIYRYDLITGASTLWREPQVDFDPADYVVEQVFYESTDGTRVPMFLAHMKGLERDGSHPTLLYGYGGFDNAMTPYFSVSRLAWMELGGVFALANLRGGGEYGEAWHEAGKLERKQNVFDDFIAAAEHLIEEKITSPEKLAIQGGSNGGLLVGAVMTQRPELFGAALPAVGVMDMLRFHQFTAGRFWVDEYGSADDPEMFPVLLDYSPYHNLVKGTEYPATLVTTADTDDRVVPGHSFKFAARLQHVHTGDDPVLIRIETRAGHGSGKPTSKIIEEVADEWAFLVEVLGMEPDLGE